MRLRGLTQCASRNGSLRAGLRRCSCPTALPTRSMLRADSYALSAVSSGDPADLATLTE